MQCTLVCQIIAFVGPKCTELGFCQWLNGWEWMNESDLLLSSTSQQGWFYTRQYNMHKHLARYWKQCDTSIVLAFRPRALALIDRNKYAPAHSSGTVTDSPRLVRTAFPGILRHMNQHSGYFPEISHRHKVTSLTWSSLLPVETGLVVGICGVTDPPIRQPGLDLPRHTRSLMNGFWFLDRSRPMSC